MKPPKTCNLLKISWEYGLDLEERIIEMIMGVLSPSSDVSPDILNALRRTSRRAGRLFGKISSKRSWHLDKLDEDRYKISIRTDNPPGYLTRSPGPLTEKGRFILFISTSSGGCIQAYEFLGIWNLVPLGDLEVTDASNLTDAFLEGLEAGIAEHRMDMARIKAVDLVCVGALESFARELERLYPPGKIAFLRVKEAVRPFLDEFHL